MPSSAFGSDNPCSPIVPGCLRGRGVGQPPTAPPWGNPAGKWPDQTCHHTAEQVTPPQSILGVHKSARETPTKRDQINTRPRQANLLTSASILYLIIYTRLSLPLFSLSLAQSDFTTTHCFSKTNQPVTRPSPIYQVHPHHTAKMFQQRAAQRLFTTLRPHIARRMIATQPSKAVQETVSKGEFFTSVIAFSGATGVILACVTAPSSSS